MTGVRQPNPCEIRATWVFHGSPDPHGKDKHPDEEFAQAGCREKAPSDHDDCIQEVGIRGLASQVSPAAKSDADRNQPDECPRRSCAHRRVDETSGEYILVDHRELQHDVKCGQGPIKCKSKPVLVP